jgi:hypothetical protein
MQVLKHRMFWIGIILVLFGCALFYFNQSWIGSGIILLCGILIIYADIKWKLNEQPEWIKLLIIIAPGTVVGIYFYLSRPYTEILHLPKGYRGPVVIVYDKVEGIPVNRQGRSLVVQVPTSGYVKVNFDPDKDLDFQAICKEIDSKGNQKEIPACVAIAGKSGTEPTCWLLAGSGTYEFIPGTNSYFRYYFIADAPGQNPPPLKDFLQKALIDIE